MSAFKLRVRDDARVFTKEDVRLAYEAGRSIDAELPEHLRWLYEEDDDD